MPRPDTSPTWRNRRARAGSHRPTRSERGTGISMRILVVGLGSMGRRRIRNLRAIGGQELGGVEPSERRRAAVADELGIPTWGSVDEAMAWEPDALIISTPPDHHTEYALYAARRGLPFFTEASVVADGMDELIEVARRTGVTG